jgi:hypothetical protein
MKSSAELHVAHAHVVLEKLPPSAEIIRGIDPHAYLRDVLTRLPSMTNWQIKHVTPEAWAKPSRSSPTATAA